jgi:hypothetical protein
MPSTFTHGLLPPACVLASKPGVPPLSRMEWFKLLFASAVLGNSCDLDLVPAFLFPSRWLEIHRYWGHNIFMISIWITLGAYCLGRFVSPKLKGATAWIYASVLVFSHVIFDAMGDYTGRGYRIGVPLLYPFSKWEFLLPFPIFKGVKLSPHVHPAIGHITSRSFWTDGVFRELYGSLAILAVYCVVFYGWRVSFKLYQRLVTVSQGRPKHTTIATVE